MPRFFAPITEQELRAKVDEATGDNYYPLHVTKDLKVSFDTENFEREKSYQKNAANVIGVHTLPNGLTFWGMCGGGDWEYPVYFIVYWSGKELRAYVPTEGNLWNTDTNEAYGNNEDADHKNIKKRFFADTDPEDIPDHLSWEECPDANGDKMIADIMERLLPVGQKPPAQSAKKPKTQKPKGLGERIKALTYYGTGDEGYELFQAACSFCYRLCGLNDAERAEIVYGWAKEMAEGSKKWAKEQYGDEWNDDKASGQWGY